MQSDGIKSVAIYLRKSREDGEDTLRKQRIMLVDFAEKKNWDYILFEEAPISGEFLSKRPVISGLLDRIEANEFDAVLVKALDRLTRGDEKDLGEILRTVRYADCFIATPERIYDPTDVDESMFLAMQGAFANRELNTIKRRFQDGKKIGARDGKMTNGKPPFPYYYHKEIIISEKGQDVIGSVRIDTEKQKIYENIIKLYLSQSMGTEKIAFHLNQKGISSPNGKNWSSTVVSRLLLDEFHKGVSIYGKTKTKKNRAGKIKVTKLPRHEWNIGSGNWEILKTEEEHNEILRITQSNNHIPHRAKEGVFPTSGIMFCEKCGYSMRYSQGKYEIKSKKTYYYTKCSHKSPMGVKCGQRGVKMNEVFFDAIREAVINRKMNNSEIKNIDNNVDLAGKLISEINEVKGQIIELEKVLVRIKEAYNLGAYDVKEFIEEKKKYEIKMKKLLDICETLEKKRKNTNKLSENLLDERIDNFKKDWDNASSKEKNELLKTVVNKILYNREGNKLSLKIEYI